MPLFTEFNQGIRRAAVRLAGQGPRSIGASALQKAAAVCSEQPGSAYVAPAERTATERTPELVSLWPTVAAREPARCAILLSEAGLYDDDGVVYDLASRQAYPETLDYTLAPPPRHPVFHLPRATKPRRLPGLSLFLGGLGGQTFYHFLVEILPKLALLAPLLPKAGRLIVQHHTEAAKLAWLKQLGIQLPVEWLQPLAHLQCEQLAFCPPVVEHYRPNPWTVATLRQLCAVPPAAPARRHRYLWVDRREAPVRAAAWERELIERLPAPWEPVDFAKLSPAETLALGAECAGLAGLHGAGFANLALFPPGVRVLEIYTQPHETWYPCLSLSAGHHHQIAFATSSAAIPGLCERLARRAQA